MLLRIAVWSESLWRLSNSTYIHFPHHGKTTRLRSSTVGVITLWYLIYIREYINIFIQPRGQGNTSSLLLQVSNITPPSPVQLCNNKLHFKGKHGEIINVWSTPQRFYGLHIILTLNQLNSTFITQKIPFLQHKFYLVWNSCIYYTDAI